jgi:DNA polymerase III subunit gamma/tau
MSNFTVSARKYRPGTFDTVVGQNHVTQTLKNAIKKGHIGHSFLFCGPRGVGKTTCARILAKALNCENLTAEGEPCGTCAACTSFQNHQSFNIYELDAASNNSVDDIRSLNEQVRFAPQNGRYKIYIIDEVHMLSTAAFNAFLKTLEEPPSYAIFILATTEKHKILPTILSRCQVFDFHRIGIKAAIEHLKDICRQENIEAEEEGLYIIAQKADGALRDALSIFDKVASFSGEKITYQDVIDNLNVLDYEYYFNIIDLALEQNLPAALLKFDEILTQGFDAHNFLNGLSEHLRNLLICKDPSTIKLLELSEGTQNLYINQSRKTSMSFLLSGLNILNQFDIQYKASKNQRLHVELSLMKLCYIPDVLNMEEPQGVEKKKSEPRFDLKKPEKYGENAIVIIEEPKQNGVRPVPVQQAVTTPPAPVASETVTENPPATAPAYATAKKLVTQVEVPAEFTLNIQKIKENLQQARKEASENEVESESFQKVDPEAFSKAWQGYLDHTFKKKLVALHTGIKNSTPDFLGEKVVIQVSSQIIRNMLLDEKQNMVDFMGQRYNIRPFMLEVLVTQALEADAPKYHSESDKLKLMMAKNPAFEDMVKRFDLRLDY